jgi:hypothetical protein
MRLDQDVSPCSLDDSYQLVAHHHHHQGRLNDEKDDENHEANDLNAPS